MAANAAPTTTATASSMRADRTRRAALCVSISRGRSRSAAV
jgi:hypothetical protein